MEDSLSGAAVVVQELGADELYRAAAVASASLDLDSDDACRIPGYVWGDGVAARLVASLEGADVGTLIGSVHGTQAFLDLVAVRPEARRRGVASALLRTWHDAARALGANELRIGENLHGYAWPGVDIRYTPALCLFKSAGYERTAIAYNMDLPLHEQLGPSKRQIQRLAKAGIEVRRATACDRAALAAHVRSIWTEVWAREVLVALAKSPPAVFIAVRGRTILGFAAHGVYRPSLYGPIATDPREQGHGVGEVLSRLCLADMFVHGIRDCQIGWVAEDAVPFYSRTVGARLGRCFWIMRRIL